jgi:Flp pilus assembly protein TadD
LKYAWLVALLVCACHTITPREHALLLLSRGQTNEGVGELERLRDKDRNDPRAWIDLGHGYELQHRYDAALAAYDQAAQVAPSDPRGPREGGLRCAKWGEHAAALPRLEEAIRRGDDEPATYHALGLVRLQLNDRKGAREAYTAGLKTPRGKDDSTCVLGLATLAVVEDDPTEALRWYDELVKRRPTIAAPYLGRAWALAKLKRFKEADEAIEEARSRGAPADERERLEKFVAEMRAKP